MLKHNLRPVVSLGNGSAPMEVRRRLRYHDCMAKSEGNPKSENRNPKENEKRENQNSKEWDGAIFELLDLDFRLSISFGFRGC
jgi:hypothetical protein